MSTRVALEMGWDAASHEGEQRSQSSGRIAVVLPFLSTEGKGMQLWSKEAERGLTEGAALVRELCEHLQGLPLEDDVLSDAVRDLAREALVLDHLPPNLLPRLLVQLVDGGADGPELGGRDAGDVHHCVQEPAVVELHLQTRGGSHKDVSWSNPGRRQRRRGGAPRGDKGKSPWPPCLAARMSHQPRTTIR